MKGFVADIEELTDDNSDYRRVLYTGTHLQLVLMSLAPDEEITLRPPPQLTCLSSKPVHVELTGQLALARMARHAANSIDGLASSQTPQRMECHVATVLFRLARCRSRQDWSAQLQHHTRSWLAAGSLCPPMQPRLKIS